MAKFEHVHAKMQIKGSFRIICSDFIWPILTPYMGVILNTKMAFIFPIS